MNHVRSTYVSNRRQAKGQHQQRWKDRRDQSLREIIDDSADVRLGVAFHGRCQYVGVETVDRFRPEYHRENTDHQGASNGLLEITHASPVDVR